MNQKINDIRLQVMKEIDDARYQHTLGVMYTAASMAMRYGEDVEKAMIAGLLHDCAKCLSHQKRLSVCKKNNIPITKVEMQNPVLLHAKVGAFYAKEKYGVEDVDILSAITYHTTGRPNMSLLEKIIYVADYIEPHRKKLPRLDEIRKIAFIDLDRAIYMILENSLSYLESGNEKIDSKTEETYRFYKNVMEKRGSL